MKGIGKKKIVILSLCLILIVFLIWYFLFSKKEETNEILTSFELMGERDIYILLNGTFDDPKAIATVNGSDYSPNIKVVNNCDMSKVGDCTIVYALEKFNQSVERIVHVSDSSDWFKMEYDGETGQEKITINISIDKDRISRYILPNGVEKSENDSYLIEKNGTYTFKIYDIYDNVLEKQIVISNIVIRPLEVECSATVNQNNTTIKVNTNKQIIKYIYNGESSDNNTYTFNKRIKSNKVTVYDTDNQSKDVVCQTEVKPYNSFGAYKHVFIIGVDGLGATFSKVSSPNFDKIFGNYAYRHNAKSEYETISAQNWGSILTGVAYNVHGLTNDIISKQTRSSKSKYLTIFYYVKRSIPNANLVSVVNWNPINSGLIEKDLGVHKIHGGSDAEVVNHVIGQFKSDAPTLLFVQFDEVDHAGHASGGFSTQYYNAAKTADKRIGQIYAEIDKKGLMKDSLFIVVADHGETKNGHGGHTTEESTVELAIRGYTVNKMTLPSTARNRDVAAIALYALGINKPSHLSSTVYNGLFGEPR